MLDPPLRALLARLAPRGGRLGALAGGKRALAGRLGGRTQLRGHRPYSPGDEPASLDWAVYARRDALFVREFAPDADRTTTLVLDSSASMGDPGGPFPDKAHAVRRLCAALMYLGLWSQGTVRAVSFGGDEAQTPRVFHGMGDFDRALAWLSLRPAGGVSDPRRALRGALRGADPGSVVLVSDLHFDPRLLRECASANCANRRLTVWHTLSPREFHAPAPGLYSLTDVESGRRMDLSVSAATSADYARALDAWCALRRKLIDRLGGRYHLIDLATPLERLLRIHGIWEPTAR